MSINFGRLAGFMAQLPLNQAHWNLRQ